MSGRSDRFEIVTTDDGHHGRYRSANGRIVWITPGELSAKAGVRNAIELVAGPITSDASWHGKVRVSGTVVEVREVDER